LEIDYTLTLDRTNWKKEGGRALDALYAYGQEQLCGRLVA